MTDEPISTWTALAYPLAGLGTIHLSESVESGIFAALMLILGIATWAFHFREDPEHDDLDHAAMIGMLVGLGTMAAGAPWWMALLGAVGAAWALVYREDLYSHALIGVLFWFVMAGSVGQGAWDYLAGGVLMLGGGFWIWQQENDRAHGFWHVAGAIGLGFIAAGVL